MDYFMFEKRLQDDKNIADNFNELKVFINNQKYRLKESKDQLKATKDWNECDLTIINFIEEKEKCTEECGNLLNILHDLQQENSELLKDLFKLRKVKHSKQDMEYVDHGLEKFNYFKSLTGIRWDCSVLDIKIKGVITNKKDYIKSFNYSIETKNIKNKMWEEIYKCIKNVDDELKKKKRKTCCVSEDES